MEHDEPLAIGDMVVDTSGGLPRECEIVRIGHSSSTGSFESCIRGNDVNRTALANGYIATSSSS